MKGCLSIGNKMTNLNAGKKHQIFWPVALLGHRLPLACDRPSGTQVSGCVRLMGKCEHKSC